MSKRLAQLRRAAEVCFDENRPAQLDLAAFEATLCEVIMAAFIDRAGATSTRVGRVATSGTNPAETVVMGEPRWVDEERGFRPIRRSARTLGSAGRRSPALVGC